MLERPLNIMVPPWRQFRGCASSAEHKVLVEKKRYMVSPSIPTEPYTKGLGALTADWHDRKRTAAGTLQWFGKSPSFACFMCWDPNRVNFVRERGEKLQNKKGLGDKSEMCTHSLTGGRSFHHYFHFFIWLFSGWTTILSIPWAKEALFFHIKKGFIQL